MGGTSISQARPPAPARAPALDLIRRGCSYEEAAAALGIGAGLAYLLVTGVPCDSSDGLSPEDLAREGLLHTSSQHLALPRPAAPPTSEAVHAWLRARAASDPHMRAASGAEQE
jgi:hypothetical protein